MLRQKISTVSYFPFLLQLHTLHFAEAGAEIWAESILKFYVISFPHIIKYIAATRKHYSLVLLEITTRVHN